MSRLALTDTAAASPPREAGTFRTWLPLATLGLWAVLFAAEVLASLYLSDGNLVFTLDDPYIHLAVADRILGGGYGVNAAEFSSPSSSIVWPYLLAVTEALRLGPLGPLLINAAAAAAAVVTFVRVVLANDVESLPRAVFWFAIVVLAVFVTSSVALPMTGMEHCLHVWASLVAFAGLVEAARGRAPTWIHFAALVLLPLIRFEGIAFAIAAIVAFAMLGRPRFAAWSAAAIAVALGVYFALMAARGLPLLPSSVLLKSRLAGTVYDGSGAFAAVLRGVVANLLNPVGLRLLLLALALAGALWLLRADRRMSIVMMAVLAAVGAHLAFGPYDWFRRYEIYAVALAALALFDAAARARSVLSAQRWRIAMLATVWLVAFCSTPYVSAAMKTPLAARGIYEQQYQLAILAQKLYGKPVAVNDLGLIAYRNPNFVLDLWGLGSEKVRKAKLAGNYGPDQMGALTDEYGIGLVMIYDVWFPGGVPANWTKVAMLHTEPVTAFDADVSIYRTPRGDPAEVDAAMRAFAAVLPSRSVLERLP